MRRIVTLALLSFAAAGCSSTGIVGVYKACSMQCETLTLNADHTFKRELTGDLAGHLETDGVWSPVGNRPHVILLTPDLDRRGRGSIRADLAPAAGDGTEITVAMPGGVPLVDALVKIDCVSGRVTRLTDDHGLVRVDHCTPKHVRVTYDGFYDLSVDIGARHLHAELEPWRLTPMESEEEWLVFGGSATHLGGWTLHSTKR